MAGCAIKVPHAGTQSLVLDPESVREYLVSHLCLVDLIDEMGDGVSKEGETAFCVIDGGEIGPEGGFEGAEEGECGVVGLFAEDGGGGGVE